MNYPDLPDHRLEPEEKEYLTEKEKEEREDERTAKRILDAEIYNY